MRKTTLLLPLSCLLFSAAVSFAGGDHADGHHADGHTERHGGDQEHAHEDHGEADHGHAHDEHGDGDHDHAHESPSEEAEEHAPADRAKADHGHAHDDHGQADHGHGHAHDKRSEGGHADAHDDHHDEGRTAIPASRFAANDLAVAMAGPRPLERRLRLAGRIGIPGHHLVRVRPRFPGLVREVFGNVGDRVRAGQVLAAVESDASLGRYDVASPIAGRILERRAVAGNVATADEALFVVANLDELWADLDVYGADMDAVRVGEAVTLRDDARGIETAAVIAYVSPLRDVHTQTTLARAVVHNPDGRWSPGAFLTATVAVEEPDAAVAVPLSSLQTLEGRDTVFVVHGDEQEARPVVLGRQGEAWVEILGGLKAGEIVATGNTFLLRAEIEKEGASHDH